jgi:hypothetical protein
MNGPSRRTLIRLGVLAATLPFATFSPSFAAESPPLAIKGYDPVAYFTLGAPRGELDDGNPEYWLVSDNKLYLFGKPIGPALFQQDVAGTLVKADLNRPLIVNR